jgi:hypothetical protein
LTRKYILPAFADEVMVRLRAGDKAAFALGTRCRAYLIDALYADMMKKGIM